MRPNFAGPQSNTAKHSSSVDPGKLVGSAKDGGYRRVGSAAGPQSSHMNFVPTQDSGKYQATGHVEAGSGKQKPEKTTAKPEKTTAKPEKTTAKPEKTAAPQKTTTPQKTATPKKTETKPTAGAGATKTAPKPKEPKFVLDGSKWFIENFKDKQDIVVDITELKQTVFASNLEGCVVSVKGKANAVVVQGCKRTGVVFDDIVSNVEIINGQKLQIQANGTLPGISIDKSHGVTLYIQSEIGRKVEIVTSLSSELNVVTPGATENDDPKEQAIPQQFVSLFGANDVLHTKPVEHVGV